MFPRNSLLVKVIPLPVQNPRQRCQVIVFHAITTGAWAGLDTIDSTRVQNNTRQYKITKHLKKYKINQQSQQYFAYRTLGKILDVHTHVVRDKGPPLVLVDHVVVWSRWFVIKDHIK